MREYQEGDVIEVWRNTPLGYNSWHRTPPGHTSKIKRNKILSMSNDLECIEITEGWLVLLKDIRPKYWYIKRTDDPRWKRVIDYQTTQSSLEYFRINNWMYRGYDGNNVMDRNGQDCWGVGDRDYQSFRNNAIELTLDEWINFGYDKDIYKEEDTLPKELTVDDFNVGDTVTITNRPKTWASGTGGDYPLGGRIKFPLTGKITAKKWIADSNYMAINVDNWGLSLTHLLKEKIITKQTTNTMSQTTISRKQLLQLYDEITCSTFRGIIDEYLNSRPRAYDDSTFVVEQKHLDRIKELSPEQRKTLAQYISIPEPEITYKIGQWFKVIGFSGPCLLAQVGGSECCLIYTGSGNRIAHPIEVKDVWAVTKTEIAKMTDNPVRPIQVAITEKI